MKPDDYRLPGVLTQLTEAQQVMVAEVGDDPYSLCLAAQHLLVLPPIISGSGTGWSGSTSETSDRQVRSSEPPCSLTTGHSGSRDLSLAV